MLFLLQNSANNILKLKNHGRAKRAYKSWAGTQNVDEAKRYNDKDNFRMDQSDYFLETPEEQANIRKEMERRYGPILRIARRRGWTNEGLGVFIFKAHKDTIDEEVTVQNTTSFADKDGNAIDNNEQEKTTGTIVKRAGKFTVVPAGQEKAQGDRVVSTDDMNNKQAVIKRDLDAEDKAAQKATNTGIKKIEPIKPIGPS